MIRLGRAEGMSLGCTRRGVGGTAPRETAEIGRAKAGTERQGLVERDRQRLVAGIGDAGRIADIQAGVW
jgi:hypothetical protein